MKVDWGAEGTERAIRQPDASSLRSDATTRDDDASLALVRQQVRSFAESTLNASEIDRERRIPESVIAACRSIGLFGLTLPQVYGGTGLSLKAACAVVADLSRVERSTAIMIGLHNGLGTRGLVDLGSEEQKRRWLSDLASGERIASFCATEPNAGSDLANISTVARVNAAGLVLDGEKCFVTNGGVAGLFTVLARTPGLGGARGLSLLLVPREARGLSLGPEEDKLGIRGSSTVSVRLDEVDVAGDSVLGPPGRGLDAAYRALVWGRTLMAAGCLGGARSAFVAARSHAATRRQFGRSLAGFAAVQADLAEMARALHAMETFIRFAGQTEADVSSSGAASMAVKVFCSEATFDVCDRAVQLHGGAGFVESTGVARLLRDARIARIFEGANDVLLIRLGLSRCAARAAGEPEAPIDARRVTVGPEAADTAAAVDVLKRHSLALEADARSRFGVRVVHRQTLLRAIARTFVDRLVAEVCLLRATASGDAERVLSLSTARHFARRGMTYAALGSDPDSDLDDAAKVLEAAELLEGSRA